MRGNTSTSKGSNDKFLSWGQTDGYSIDSNPQWGCRFGVTRDLDGKPHMRRLVGVRTHSMIVVDRISPVGAMYFS